jgi:hypothetical protein
MPFGEEVLITEFVVHLMASMTEHAFKRIRPKFLRLKFARPNDDARIAFAAILRVRTDDQKYLLVRNAGRNEAFTPFGGVYKYRHAAAHSLEKLDFRPEVIRDDMKLDLRGFLPRKHVIKISDWFVKNVDRESPTECLSRELTEELAEAGIQDPLLRPNRLEFEKLRIVFEGPQEIKSDISYTQLRIFEVFDIARASDDARQFEETLIAHARRQRSKHRSLLLVSEREIFAGRAGTGEVIGNPAGYLFTQKRILPEGPRPVPSLTAR